MIPTSHRLPTLIRTILRVAALVFPLAAMPWLGGCEGTPSQRSVISPLSNYVLTVSATPRSVEANGIATTTLTINLTTLTGDLADGEVVTVGRTLGTLIDVTGEATGDGSAMAVTVRRGFATLLLRSTTSPGTSKITVTYQDIDATVLVSFI